MPGENAKASWDLFEPMGLKLKVPVPGDKREMLDSGLERYSKK